MQISEAPSFLCSCSLILFITSSRCFWQRYVVRQNNCTSSEICLCNASNSLLAACFVFKITKTLLFSLNKSFAKSAIDGACSPPGTRRGIICTRLNCKKRCSKFSTKSFSNENSIGYTALSNAGCVAVHKTTVQRKTCDNVFMAKFSKQVSCRGSAWISSSNNTELASAGRRRIFCREAANKVFKSCTIVVHITGTTLPTLA